MFAQATIVGNIGKIEVRSTGESKVANFSLACNEKRGGVETVHWFSIAAWGALANLIESYATKGTKVLVSGRITTRKYEREGQTHTAFEITATAIELLGSPNTQNGTATASTEPQAATVPTKADPAAHRPGEDDDNDLPF